MANASFIGQSVREHHGWLKEKVQSAKELIMEEREGGNNAQHKLREVERKSSRERENLHVTQVWKRPRGTELAGEHAVLRSVCTPGVSGWLLALSPRSQRPGASAALILTQPPRLEMARMVGTHQEVLVKVKNKSFNPMFLVSV